MPKAILIKYMPATNTRGVRLKATTEAGTLEEGRTYENEPDEQARQLAEKYIKHVGWFVKITGFGTLPNGDYVATIG